MNNFRVSLCLRCESVIPFLMEGISVDIQSAQVVIADLAAFCIARVVQPGLNGEASFRCRVPDEVDAGLDLIPLARTRRTVRDLEGQVEISGQPLEFGFPQAHPAAVTAAPGGCDIELRGLLVSGLSQLLPPGPNRRHGKFRRSVTDPHAPPPLIFGQVIDPVRNDLALLRIEKIRDPPLRGLAARRVLAPGILKIAQVFFLLGVHRDHRLGGGLKALHLLIDICKLGLAIRVGRAFVTLAVRLERVPALLEEVIHTALGNPLPVLPQRRREFVRTLTRPQQRRLRLAPSHRIHQPGQILR